MIDRCHSVLRFQATQATSIPTAVTGHHITPQVFSPDILGPDVSLTSSSIYPGEFPRQILAKLPAGWTGPQHWEMS